MTSPSESPSPLHDSAPVPATALERIVGEITALRNTIQSGAGVLNEKLELIAKAIRSLKPGEPPLPWAWRTPKYHLKDIGGLTHSVRAEVDEIIGRCKSESRFASLRVPKPVGVLVIGPSGVGKTMLAHALAGEMSSALCVVSGPSLLDSLSRFDQLFAEALGKAKPQQPAVVFLDELEVLTEHRYGTRTSGIDALRHLFLVKIMTQLEELRGRDVLVVGATNRVDMLDPAVLRSGRFEKQLYLDFPTSDGRRDILRKLNVNQKLEMPARLLDEVASNAGADAGTSGFSGADLADLLTEMAVHAALRGSATVDESDVRVAVRRVRRQMTRRSTNDPETTFTRSLVSVAPLPGPPLGLKRVAGLESAKRRMKVIVKMLTEPGLFQTTRAVLPRGVLLSGPPGVGKTLLARALAEEAKVPFFHVSASDFTEMFVGVGAARVRDTFRLAKHQAPSVLFIDEIDAFGSRRGTSSRGDAEFNQTLNELLTQLSGMEDTAGIVVIAATNRPALLDEALTRPGRFDYRIDIDYPSDDERRAIFALYEAAGDNISQGKRDQVLADPRINSGAAIASLLNAARIHSVLDGDKRILDKHLDKAFDDMSPPVD